METLFEKKLKHMGMECTIEKSAWNRGKIEIYGVEIKPKTKSKLIYAKFDSILLNWWDRTIELNNGNSEVSVDSIKEPKEERVRPSGWKVEVNNLQVVAHHPYCEYINAKSIYKSGDQIEVGYANAECMGNSVLVSNAISDGEFIKISYVKLEIGNGREIISKVFENRSPGSQSPIKEDLKKKFEIGTIEVLDKSSATRITANDVSFSDNLKTKEVKLEIPNFDFKSKTKGLMIEKKNEKFLVSTESNSFSTNSEETNSSETSDVGMEIDTKAKNVSMRYAGSFLNISLDVKSDKISASVNLEADKCDDLIRLVPASPEFHELRMGGGLLAKLDISISNYSLPEKKAEVSFQMNNGCTAQKLPEFVMKTLNDPTFTVERVGSEGEYKVQKTGPKSGNWVKYDDISKYLVYSILETEDSGFFQHRGISINSVSEAIKEDIENGRFRRGASTISMQLSKNLWLNREKTLSRKAQEFFLTQILEQNFSKTKILEYYFNVVEFGPNIYGIQDASDKLFGVKPRDLTIVQSIAIIHLLPNPKAKIVDGGVIQNPYKSRILRTLNKLIKNNRISELEYERSIKELEEDVSQTTSWSLSDN